MNGTFNSNTTTLKDNGVVKVLPTREFFEIIAKQFIKKKRIHHKHVVNDKLTIVFNIGETSTISTRIKFNVPKAQYRTSYRKGKYNIWLPELEIEMSFIDKKIQWMKMKHKGQILDLPNTFSDAKMCLGSMEKECYPNESNAIQWVKAYICSEWSGDVMRKKTGFISGIDLFKWLETPHKSYQKIIRKGNK